MLVGVRATFIETWLLKFVKVKTIRLYVGQRYNGIAYNSLLFIEAILILLHILRAIVLYKQVYFQLITQYYFFAATCFNYNP